MGVILGLGEPGRASEALLTGHLTLDRGAQTQMAAEPAGEKAGEAGWGPPVRLESASPASSGQGCGPGWPDLLMQKNKKKTASPFSFFGCLLAFTFYR